MDEEEISLNLGIREPDWSGYENGTIEPDVNTIVKISKFFNVSLDTLLLTDLSKESASEIQISNIEKEIKQIMHELAAHKKEIEHIKKIMARR